MPRTGGAPAGTEPLGRSVPPAGYAGDGQAGWAGRTGGFRVPAGGGGGVTGGTTLGAGMVAPGSPGDAGASSLRAAPAGPGGAATVGGGTSGPRMQGGGGFSGGAGGIGLEATFGGYGFGFGPAVGGGPGFERALSVAQNQLALRRQLRPSGDAELPNDPGLAYSATQVLEGLTALQHSLTATAEPALLGAESVRQQVNEALRARGVEGKTVGRAEGDVIEIIVNLFESLLQDARLGEFAKGNLKRLQGSVHRAALVDDEFLASTHHPLRQLLNRVSMLNTVPGAKGQQLQARLREMIDGINLGYDRDPSVVQPLIEELDDVLREQRDGYETNLRQMVNGCEEQQRFLRERRERAGEAPAPPPTFPAELNRWIARAKGLRVGDRLLMNANTRNPNPVTLAWIGDDFNPYVLADARGMKAASLTLQQVAMYLRRGLIKVLLDDEESAVDRALFGVVNRLHEQVVDQAAHDPLTGLPTRKAFLQAVEAQFPQGQQADPGAVLCEISVENLKSVNDQFGTLTGDQLIKRIGEELRAHCDAKTVLLGRLGGSELGIYWTRGGLQGAYRDAQALIEKLRAIELPTAPGTGPRLVAGLAAVDGDLAQIDPLMTAVHEACGFARTQPEMPIYVAGTDTRQRKQLEQMQSYVAKAIERGRLALLFHEIRALGSQTPPAARLVVSAEDRNGKLVPPALFSQAATSSAHAWDVDLWTLRSMLRWMAGHGDESERFSAFVIPLSRAALEREDLATLIVNELMETAVPPARVCFEIEDRTALARLAETTDLINTLREFGCQFILGEFGGVQGNYEYLKELAVSFVGIQSSAIADARQDPKDHAIAKSINELAHFMGKLTIGRIQGEAGGIDLLRELKVDFAHDSTRATRLILETDERQA